LFEFHLFIYFGDQEIGIDNFDYTNPSLRGEGLHEKIEIPNLSEIRIAAQSVFVVVEIEKIENIAEEMKK
jgi:hypothetical protein